MPDLSAAQWSKTAIAALHKFEQQCQDLDLFCVGYLIPQVELVAQAYEDCSDTQMAWRECLLDYVTQSIEQDQLDEADQQRVFNIVETCL